LDAEDFSPGLRRPGRGVDLSYLCPLRLVECHCTFSSPVYLYGAHRGDFATTLPICTHVLHVVSSLGCSGLSCMLHMRLSQCGWFNLPKSIRHKFRNSSLCSFQFWFLFWNECLWCQFLVRGCTISVDFSLFCKYR